MKSALAVALTAGMSLPLLSAQQPDNTSKNKRDRAESAVTADEQGNSPEDRDMTKKIRAEIVDDKTLSTYAHNIKVITRDGMVTLKGPVRSEAEKTRIATIAAKHAGEAKVTNHIEIAPDKPETK
jgi:osmotically-inducible protein OsmY